MAVRRNLIAITVLAITGTTAAGGAAYAAAGTGSTPNPKPPAACSGKPGSPNKGEGQDKMIAAAARDLGVTAPKLTDALTATKVWLGTTHSEPTSTAFAGHVASLLGLSSDKVKRVLVADGVISDDPVKTPGVAAKVKESSDEQNARITAAAKALGVTAAQLSDAIVSTKQWVGTSGTKPTPEAFTAHVASLLGKPADKVQRALDASGMFSSTPKQPSDPKGKGQVCDGPGDKQQAEEIAAAAHELGVTAAKLNDALVASKVWMGTQAKPTPAAFVGHVASLLGKPADKVQHALVAAGVLSADDVTTAKDVKDAKDADAVASK